MPKDMMNTIMESKEMNEMINKMMNSDMMKNMMEFNDNGVEIDW